MLSKLRSCYVVEYLHSETRHCDMGCREKLLAYR